jgi:ribosomal protein S18 acetylase RimI-like enzyme
MAITVRPVQPDDLDFLFEVYAATRLDELRQTGWDPAQIEAFLRSQFLAQHAYYQAHYPDARFEIILADGRTAGRRYIDRGAGEIRLVDLALLPSYRGQGIGTSLLKALLAEGQDAGMPVTIHVEKLNPALHLYERLGFKRVADCGIYWFLEWRPPSGIGCPSRLSGAA